MYASRVVSSSRSPVANVVYLLWGRATAMQPEVGGGGGGELGRVLTVVLQK
jgi:hypothetical protein